MTEIDQLRRVAIAGVVLAILVSIVSTGLLLAAFDWNVEAMTFGDPRTILTGGAQAAILWRWGMLGDMFYSYLLLVPLALYAHRRLRDRKPWLVDLGLIGGLAYMLIGAASAAMLAIAGSALIERFAAAAPAEQFAIAQDFELLRDMLYFGIWQTLDAITAGTWVLSMGWVLLSDRPRLGRLLVVLAAGLWVLALMTMLGVHSLAVLGAIVVGVLVVWLGWSLLDRRRPAGDARSPSFRR